MSDMEEKKDKFDILDEAQRIVAGKSKGEAASYNARDSACLYNK